MRLRAPLAHADRLLDCSEPPVEHPRAWQALKIRKQAGSQAGHRLEAAVDKGIEGRLEAFSMDQRGVMDIALQPEIVGAAGRHSNPVARAIDIFHDYFRSTDGYAVIWPVVAIPILAVIPLVALLAEAESDLKYTARRPAS